MEKEYINKDPAFLFYSSDFLTGTMFMTDSQLGKYIKILCTQHQKGHLSEKDMLKICKRYDKDIFEKFAKDNDGIVVSLGKRILRTETAAITAVGMCMLHTEMMNGEDK